MRSGGRQGGGERLAGGWRSPPSIPPSRGGGGYRGPAGALGALRRPAPGPPPGGRGVFGFEIWLFWKLLGLE